MPLSLAFPYLLAPCQGDSVTHSCRSVRTAIALFIWYSSGGHCALNDAVVPASARPGTRRILIGLTHPGFPSA